jgi:hypothetical protein
MIPITPTPEPQLAMLLNLVLPGWGQIFSAFYKKGGFVDFMTFAHGFAVHFAFFFCVYIIWWLWPIANILAFIIWCWAQIASYLTFKVSKETYFS